jgi:ribonucleoside-diphosphate reductase alpha chain
MKPHKNRVREERYEEKKSAPPPQTPQPEKNIAPIATTPTPTVVAEKEPETLPLMRIQKRDGSLETVHPEKIIRRIERCAAGLDDIDPMRVAVKTIGGLHDGATTTELDHLAINTAALFMLEEPEYSKLAARLLTVVIAEECAMEGIYSFSQSIMVGHSAGLIDSRLAEFVTKHAGRINGAVNEANSDLFEYFGLRTVYERYLLKHPTTRNTIETPQYFFMRVACGLAANIDDAIEYYKKVSAFDFMPSTPTLFNSGTTHPQMSSCFLIDSPQDSLESIYQRYWDIAALSKYSGGIGIAYHRVRSQGSLIRGTNGFSNGIVPWLKTLDSSVAAVNQGGKRKGACCVYLESWHADIEDFLELRDSTGDQNRRAHQINLANWVPDVFMGRVEEDGMWSLFDPSVVPDFTDLYGEEFTRAYMKAEAEGLYMKQVKARDLYARMMKTLAETGNGWMTFKDACNTKSNQTGKPGNVIHSSNLCTEIVEVTSNDETAVCNLGSINLANHVKNGQFDFEKLGKTADTAIRMLDRVIDLNMYPIEKAKNSNMRWRPVGLGLMGLQDTFFKLGLAFDDPQAFVLSQRIQEEIYYHALKASLDLAERLGQAPAFPETRTAGGKFSFELWGVTPRDPARFDALRERMQKVGLRNTLLIAIAPTATIASIIGVFESIEPQVSNTFKRETMSGEFVQINRSLIIALKKEKLWNAEIRNKIKQGEGSIQHIAEIPERIRQVYRTVWEIPMRGLIDMAADRAPFIDQGQSLNLFIQTPSITKLSSMYMHAWKRGHKTTYYLRSRPATSIAKTTTDGGFGSVSLDNSVTKAAPSTPVSGPTPLPGMNPSIASPLTAQMPQVMTTPPMAPVAQAAATTPAIINESEDPMICEACQ